MAEPMPEGQLMPPDPTETTTPDLDDMSDDALEAALAEATGERTVEDVEVPEVQERRPPDDMEVTAAKAKEPEAEPEATPEPEAAAAETQEEEFDPDEGARIESDRLKAKLDLQQAHSSRLAGEIGHLKQMLQQQAAAPRPEVQRDPDAYDDLSDVGSLRQEVLRLRQEQQQIRQEKSTDSVTNAVNAEFQTFLSQPETQTLQNELAKSIPAYAQDLQAAGQAPTPELARMITQAALRSATADARDLRFQARKAEAEAKSTTNARSLKDKKRANNTTESTAAPADPTPKRKTIAELSDDELDDMADRAAASLKR